MSDAEWWDLHVARCRTAEHDGPLNGIPGMPSAELQRNTTGQVGEATLREAFDFYRSCKQLFERQGCRLTPDVSLLDFGVGWGRVARFFLREVQLANVFGIDVDPELIATCRRTFGSENFVVCAPQPPAPFRDGSFDVVVGYSVFSHLSEEACRAWIAEFRRLLKPSGMLALTTRGRFFFDYCRTLEAAPGDQYARSLASMFDDFEIAKARYDAGEFVHSSRGGVAGSGPRGGGFYGETFIPRGYAASAWKTHFELVEFEERPLVHPIMFLRPV